MKILSGIFGVFLFVIPFLVYVISILRVIGFNDFIDTDYILVLLAMAIILIFIKNLIDKAENIETEYEYRQYLIKELESKESQDTDGDRIDKIEKEDTNENAEQVNEKCDSITINEQKKDDKKDIIALMLKNNDEITEYFKISKSQARSSFGLSVFFCILGIAPLAAGIYCIVVLKDISVSIISLVSGSISEFISATIFWLHNKSALQLNHYYDALHENEKFLSAVNIADKLSDEKREEILVEIIRKQISGTTPKIEKDNEKEK